MQHVGQSELLSVIVMWDLQYVGQVQRMMHANIYLVLHSSHLYK